MKRIVILGAGVAGLTLAWFLKRRFGDRIDLKVIDCEKEVSLDIFTDKRRGFLFEQGYSSFGHLSNGSQTFKLLGELGISNQIIYSNPNFFSKYILQKNGFKKIYGKLYWSIFSFLRGNHAKPGDESMYDFFLRSFGKNFTTQIAAPYVRPFYGDIRKLSFKACFPNLQFLNKIFSKEKTFSLKGGMETLIDELTQRLDPYICRTKDLQSLNFSPNSVKISFTDGTNLEADHVFSTISTLKLAKLFSPIHRGLAKLLKSIPYQKRALVNIGYHNLVMKKKTGSYFFHESIEKNIMAVFVDSSVFLEQNQIPEETRLAVVVNMEGLDEKEVVRYVLKKLSKYFSLDKLPFVTSTRILYESYPEYLVDHSLKVNEIENIMNRVFSTMTIVGKSIRGVDVNDLIVQSKNIEEHVFL